MTWAQAHSEDFLKLFRRPGDQALPLPMGGRLELADAIPVDTDARAGGRERVVGPPGGEAEPLAPIQGAGRRRELPGPGGMVLPRREGDGDILGVVEQVLPIGVARLLGLECRATPRLRGEEARPVEAAPDRGGAIVRRMIIRQLDGSRFRMRAVRTPGGWLVARDWVTAYYSSQPRDCLGDDDRDDADAPAAATVATSRPSPGRRSAAERRATSEKAAQFLRQLGRR